MSKMAMNSLKSPFNRIQKPDFVRLSNLQNSLISDTYQKNIMTESLIY